MLKPQLYCENGQGQGDLTPTDPAAWFASYATFINHYAQIAQNNGVELFCVGCELNHLDTSTYDANWRTVISGVRAIYNGPLTYAADWSTYARIPFWGALDYAGIDAYFPLSNAKTPSVADLVRGWSNYVDTTAERTTGRTRSRHGRRPCINRLSSPRSGTGASTTLRCLLGIIKCRELTTQMGKPTAIKQPCRYLPTSRGLLGCSGGGGPLTQMREVPATPASARRISPHRAS